MIGTDVKACPRVMADMLGRYSRSHCRKCLGWSHDHCRVQARDQETTLGAACLTAGLHAVDEQDYRKEGGDVHLAYDTAMAEQVSTHHVFSWIWPLPHQHQDFASAQSARSRHANPIILH